MARLPINDKVQIQSPQLCQMAPIDEVQKLKFAKAVKFRGKSTKDKSVYSGGSQAMHNLNLF